MVWEKEAEEGEIQDSLPMRREQMGTAVGEDGTDVMTPVSAEEDKILLLVDAAKTFNQLNCLGMLWTIRHQCPKVSRFSFNCYRNNIRLLLWRPEGLEALILMSK